MCCNDPNLPPAVNTAKGWAIPSMIFALIACVGFLGGAWIQGIGGIIGLVGSSVVICCVSNPPSPCNMMASFILQLLGSIMMILGAVVGLVIYFGVVDEMTNGLCNSDGDTSVTTQSEQDCLNFTLGITGIVIFPSVGLGIIAGILMLVAGIMSYKAYSVVKNGPKPTGVATGVPV